MTHIPGSASYRYVYRRPPPPGAVPICSEAGVLGAIAGILGTILAAEAVKYITGEAELLINRILTFDALTMEFHTIPVKVTEWAVLKSRGGRSPEVLEDDEQAFCDIETARAQRQAAGAAL